MSSKETVSGRGTVAILGAGLVGLACARALQRAGFQVTVVDRGGPGEGASFGNASHIATASVIPQATPGILRQTINLLRDPTGPLVARPGYVAKHLPWFLRFISNGNPATMKAGSLAMAAMIGKAWDSWLPVLDDINARHLVIQSGALHVFRSQAALDAAQGSYAFRRDLGVASERLNAEAARAMEPTLSPGIGGAMHVPSMGYVTDTLSLSLGLAARIEQDGGRIVKATATGLDAKGIQTQEGRIEADLVVLAAGAWSQAFAKQLGVHIPLVSERGYHVMLPRESSTLRMPLLLVERKVAVTPMEKGIRLASMAEFDVPDAKPDHDRAVPVLTGLDGWAKGLDAKPISRWVGPRPSVPDSRPVIGRAPGAPNVLLACGHGHLGLTLAALTGDAITALALGQPPEIDMEAVSPLRFR